jgi:hypothetical protein
MPNKQQLEFLGSAPFSPSPYVSIGYPPDSVLKFFPPLQRILLHMIDGGFAPADSSIEGLYQVSTIGPVMIVSWRDYSVYTRPSTIATIVGTGFGNPEEMIDAAFAKFPIIMGRMPRPLPLSDELEYPLVPAIARNIGIAFATWIHIEAWMQLSDGTWENHSHSDTSDDELYDLFVQSQNQLHQ